MFLNTKAAKLRMRTSFFYRVQSRCLVLTSTRAGKAYHRTNAIRTTYQKEPVFLASCTMKTPDDCKWPTMAPCSQRPRLHQTIENTRETGRCFSKPASSRTHSTRSRLSLHQAKFWKQCCTARFAHLFLRLCELLQGAALFLPFKDSQPWCC